MNLLAAIRLAGALHLLVAAANFVLPRLLRYRESLAPAPPIIRQIFHVHAFYIVLVLAGIGAACLAFPRELAGATPLGRALSAFLAIFWFLRIVIQLAYYDRAVKERYWPGHFAFTTTILYFAAVFAAAALHRP